MTTSASDLSVEVQGRTNILPIQNSPEPVDFVRWLEKRVLAKDVHMLSLDDILDRADRCGRDGTNSLDMLGNEQEVVRIDMPMLDEAPSLLRAATGVLLVDQTALVVHEAVKVAAGAGQALTEVVGGHLQHFAANRIAGTEDRTKRENQPLLPVQTKQHPHRAAVLGFFDQKRQLDWQAFRIRQVEIGRIVDGGTVVDERGRSCLRPPAFHVKDVIGGDAVKPCAKRALALEGAELGDDLNQHLLGDLFRVLWLKDHSDGDVVDPRLVPLDELF